MAEIKSDGYRSSVEGTANNDSIDITGSHLTVQAYRGDDLIQIGQKSWTYDNVIYAGGDNDSVTVQSSATVYGETGNDYFEISSSEVSANGGTGNDVFYLDTSDLNKYLNSSISYITISGGDGNDTIKLNPQNNIKINAVVTDFSTSDVLVNENDFDNGESLKYKKIREGIVISDSDPNSFNVTLKGVYDISSVSDAVYSTPGGSRNFNDIFVNKFTSLQNTLDSLNSAGGVSPTSNVSLGDDSIEPEQNDTVPTSNVSLGGESTEPEQKDTVPAITIVDELDEQPSTPPAKPYEDELPDDEVILIDTATNEKIKAGELDSSQTEVETTPGGDTYYITNHNTYIIDQTQISNQTDITNTTNYVDASTTNNIDNSTNINNTTNIDNTAITNNTQINNDNRTYNDNSTNVTNTSISNTTTTNNTQVNVDARTTNNYISNTTTNMNVSVGISLNQNIMTINNQFTEQLWLNGTNLITGQPTRYSNNDANITRIDASQLTGSRILAGNGQNNLITAGSGGSSMWGSGAGTYNTLQGGSGRDMIFWVAEHDELHNFQMGRYEVSDVLNLQNVSISDYSRDTSYMSFTATDGSSVRFVDPRSANDIIQYTTDGNTVLNAKIGLTGQANNLVYEDGVTFYSGGAQTVDILEVNGGESRNIGLDGSFGPLYEHIDNINASSSYGNNQLFGNTGSNEIRAGSGKDTLWGGAGSADDVLFAGSGEDTFRYGIGEGNDVIVNSVSTDVVDFYNMSLSEIVSTDVVGSDLVVTAYNGQSLKIQGENGASTFMFADRSAYNYSREMHSWNRLN